MPGRIICYNWAKTWNEVDAILGKIFKNSKSEKEMEMFHWVNSLSVSKSN